MPGPRTRTHKITLRLTNAQLRRWEHIRRSLSDGEVVPPHTDALMMVLELVEEASPGRLGRLTERWRSRDEGMSDEA